MAAPLAYDASYLKSISGILKLCCLLLILSGILCIVCSSVNVNNLRGILYNSVAAFAFCCTTLVLLANLFQLWERKFSNLYAFKYEMYLHVALAIGFFMISGFVLSLDMLTYSLAAFFGYLTFISYAVDAFLSYRTHQTNDAATQTQDF